ncbi:hypothetical protein EXIGLDRAFT_778206 [Exidia glandulosa HHB12029]|uniref:Uncharacterized protein n=1 Tax=Exidia glandulosa HHB12029 TaxID=1314781 RepID=A0A165CND3_EXIGL|nr:hypothetical protein EXIGLDRAFT_778206 [Exidia glandulosa HHB12029]
MDSGGETYDAATAHALRDVYEMAWGKRNLDHEFYEEVAFRVPASSSSGSPSSEYTAKFLRVGDIQYFTQLVREENNIVLAAVNSAINRAALVPHLLPRLVYHQRLLDGQQTIYLDDIFAVCTPSPFTFTASALNVSNERLRYSSATPTLEHCIKFSESPSTVKSLRSKVSLSAKAFVFTPNGLFLTRKLLRTYKEPEEISTSDWASVNRHAAHCTWLYAVLDPNGHDDHRGRATSTVTTRDVRPYIIFPRPYYEREGCNVALRAIAQLRIAGPDAFEAMRLALADLDAGRVKWSAAPGAL